MKFINIRRSAEISDCGRYRWWLRRSWNAPQLPLESQPAEQRNCCFVMLNPSTADVAQDDPTIQRCIAFADSWGYTSLTVRNLFAWRATDPRVIQGGVGHGRRAWQRGVAGGLHRRSADCRVGRRRAFGRDKEVLALWANHFPCVPIYCFGKTKHGHPRHPLYVRGDAVPVLFVGSEIDRSR